MSCDHLPYEIFWLCCIVRVSRTLLSLATSNVQVYPGELESVIIGHPKVEDVGVVGIPDDFHGEVPKAFVVPRDPDIAASDVHAIVNGDVFLSF